MKTVFTSLLTGIILLIFSEKLIAQAPALINYQGTVRDDKGAPVINQSIALKFEILRDSPNGTVVYFDDQFTGLSTNGQGLFTTQIGKNGTLDQVDWQQSQVFFLRISIDPTGGNNLIVLGSPQQMVSVPYAMHATSVPASYTNNVLTVGTKTFNIVMTPNTSITASGMGTVTSTGTNSFDISIPPPTFSNTGQTIISGSYPNYIVSTPTVPAAITPTISITNTNAATSTVVSSGSSFSINVPPTTFTNTGQTLITGTYPNFSVATPTVAGTSIALTATAAAGPSVATIGTNSFNINIPATPNTSIVLTNTAAAGPSISAVGTNSFNINIPPANGWSLLGNAGTSTVTNFIGTTDNTDLNFRVNNVRAGRIEATTGSAYFGPSAGPPTNTSTGNTGVGFSALSGNTSGNGNTAVGYIASSSNTTGQFNTSVGGGSQMGNTTGSDNSSLGYQSLRNNSTGSFNVAIGGSAMGSGVLGSNNVALGMNAMYTSTIGSGNTMLGFGSGFNNVSGSANVFLGNLAGFNELGSNKLYIANNSTIAPLIYGDFVNNRLAIGTTTANGDLQFSNVINGRKIILWEGGNNDHQVYGFGTNTNALRYQVDASVANHIFYSGINATSSQELMRIQGNRRVGINTPAPTATFEVTGTTRLVDGTQAAGRVLTSDALGNASWQALTPATTPSMYASGIASVSPATGYNFTVSVAQPTFAYSQTNGSLTSATSSAYITPNLSLIGNTLRSGPTSNSVDLSSISPWAANGGSVFLTTTSNFVGIGTGAPNAPLQFGNTIQNRKIVLWEGANNDHQFYGIGINGATLRFQTEATTADHVFYAGTSATTSNELLRVKGNGLIKMGTETGTGQAANYPSGGMMMRRVFTSITTAGEVVGRTDQLTFERDGTYAGFRINRTGASGLLTCNCMGTNAAGASVNKAYNNLPTGVTQVFTNAENVVYFHCMFGDPYSVGHITEVTYMRQALDWYWIGTLISTFNQ